MHSIRKIFPFLSTVTDSRNTFQLAVRVRDVFGEEQNGSVSSSGMSTCVFRLSYLHVGNQVRELYEQDIWTISPCLPV